MRRIFAAPTHPFGSSELMLSGYQEKALLADLSLCTVMIQRRNDELELVRLVVKLNWPRIRNDGFGPNCSIMLRQGPRMALV